MQDVAAILERLSDANAEVQRAIDDLVRDHGPLLAAETLGPVDELAHIAALLVPATNRLRSAVGTT